MQDLVERLFAVLIAVLRTAVNGFRRKILRCGLSICKHTPTTRVRVLDHHTVSVRTVYLYILVLSKTTGRAFSEKLATYP